MAISSYLKDGKKLFKVEIKKRDANGKQIYRSKHAISSERKAEEAEYLLRKELESLILQGPSLFWPEWVKGSLDKMKLNSAYSTVRGYEASLNKWTFRKWSKKPLSEISRNDVYEIIHQPEMNITESARRNILSQIKRMLQLALEDDLILRNPAQGMTVKVPEVKKLVLTNQEVQLLLEAASRCDHPFYPIWVAALKTGMRSGELMALLWSDIDLDAKSISVTKQWTSKAGITPTKSRKNRVVPISDDFLVFLKSWRLKSQRECDSLLPQLSEWKGGEQAEVLKDFCRHINITPVKFHDLRATFITNLLARGVSLAQVMAIVGHSEIKTTNVYLRMAGVDIAGATNGLGYLIPADLKAEVLQFRGFRK